MTELKSELPYLFFPPGEYQIIVVAHYWTDPALPNNDYGTATQSAMLNFAAPEFVLLIGAMIGGLLAYIILPLARPEAVRTIGPVELFHQLFSEPKYRERFRLVAEFVLYHSVGLLVAVLLSAMITILLARVSEKLLFVRISVRDFWGAVATGFVANYASTAILTKLGVKNSEAEKHPALSSANREAQAD